METSYYKILGVNENASNYELRKAFCKLSIELHPDTTSLEIEVAKSKFQEVLEAYENLNNSNLRKIYDEKIKEKSRIKKNTNALNNYLISQSGIVSNSFPVKEAIKIEKIKLIEMMIIKRNNENNSPFEKGLLLPIKF